MTDFLPDYAEKSYRVLATVSEGEGMVYTVCCRAAPLFIDFLYIGSCQSCLFIRLRWTGSPILSLFLPPLFVKVIVLAFPLCRGHEGVYLGPIAISWDPSIRTHL